jgi:hydrogenase maturation protein HypF
MAAVWLERAFGDEFLQLDLPFARRIEPAKWRPLKRMIESGINSPPTSSMGRLFDAVAAIVLQRDAVSFEGEAAMELEAIADDRVEDGYEFAIQPDQPAVVDARPVIRAVVDDLQRGVAAGIVSARFHVAVADMIVAQCTRLRAEHGLHRVVLSGGVFQNRLLTTQAFRRLRHAGFQASTNNRIPVNDGGISFGQAVVAAANLEA